MCLVNCALGKSRLVHRKIEILQGLTGDDSVQIKWQSATESARLTSAPSTQPQPKRTAQEAGLSDYSLGAFWFTAPQRPRPHWRDRLASAPSEHGVLQLPLNSQMPSASATEQPPKVNRPWHHIWADLQDLALERSHRYLAWQVLHATLPRGTVRAYRAISRSYPQERQYHCLLGEADCPNCPGVVESIFHQLYFCPVARKVWDWVIRVWEEVSGQPVPDLGPCELLLGHDGPFRPQPDPKGLWVQLRLATMSVASDSLRGLRFSSRPQILYVSFRNYKTFSRLVQKPGHNTLCAMNNHQCFILETYKEGEQPGDFVRDRSGNRLQALRPSTTAPGHPRDSPT